MDEFSWKELVWLIPICIILGFFLTGFWIVVPFFIGGWLDSLIKNNKKIKNKKILRIFVWTGTSILALIVLYFEIITL
jgi:hypothetical protein